MDLSGDALPQGPQETKSPSHLYPLWETMARRVLGTLLRGVPCGVPFALQGTAAPAVSADNARSTPV